MTNIRFRFLTAVFLASAMTLSAAIKVHNFSGKVNVERKGSVTALKTGEVLSPADILIIPPGSRLEIINEVSGTIYTSTKDGKMTVSRLMLDAKEQASDKVGSINSHMRFGSASGKNKNERVYVETGMVKRSLGEYDPGAEGKEIDPETLTAFIRGYINGSRVSTPMPVPVDTRVNTDSVKRGFTLSNTLDFPIYFNVIKVESDGKVEISEIGQPTGSYVLRPGQDISRNDYAPDQNCGRHLIVASHCHYDIDRVLELLNIQPTAVDEKGPEITLPVYILPL